MPLAKGKSQQVIRKNIKHMIAKGHPRKQSVAASLRAAERGPSTTTGKPKPPKS